MTAVTRYLIGNGVDYLDFDLNFSGLSLAGEAATVVGTSGDDYVFSRPGLTLVMGVTGGTDRVYLSGLSTDYVIAAKGSSLSFTRNANTLLAEQVTLGTGNPLSMVVFADGAITNADILTAINNHTPGGISSLLAGETSLLPVLPNALSSTINALADSNATVFAASNPGINLILKGSALADTVYVKAGSTVDATGLGGGEDVIYMTGKWSDYSKDLHGNHIRFSRSIGGFTESVKVIADAQYDDNDRLIFADGTVHSGPAMTALRLSLSAPMNAVAGYDLSQTTSGLSDPVLATITALSADTGRSQSDFITSTALQTVSGTYTGVLGAGMIQISLDGGKTWTSASATSLNAGGGVFSLSGVTLLAATGGVPLQLLVQGVNPSGLVTAGIGHSYLFNNLPPSLSWDAVAGSDFLIATVAGVVLSGTVDAGCGVKLTLAGTVYTASVSGASWSYTLGISDIAALGPGAQTFSASATDAAGNLRSVPHTVKVAPVPATKPAISIDPIAVTNILNAAEVSAGTVISGTCSSSASSVSVQIGSIPSKFASIGSSGTTWSYTLSALDSASLGQGSVAISASTNVDQAGVAGSRASAILIDTIAPTLVGVSDTVAPAASVNLLSGTVVYRYTFSEPVVNLTPANLTCTNAALGPITPSGNGSVWQVTLTPATNLASGSLSLILNNSGLRDVAGNPADANSINARGSVSHPIDTLAPTLQSVTDNLTGSANLATGSVVYNYTFSEAVIKLTSDNFTAGNGALLPVTGSDSRWQVTLTPTAGVAGGNLTLKLNSVGVFDLAGNAADINSMATLGSVAHPIDTVAPTLQSVTDTVLPSASVNLATGSVVYSYQFSEAVTTLTAANFTPIHATLGNVTGLNVTGGNSIWQVTLLPQASVASGAMTLTLNSNSVFDLAHNPADSATISGRGSVSHPIDTLPPALLSVTDLVGASGTGTVNLATGNLVYNYLFSEPLTQPVTANFTVSNGVVGPISGGGASWQVTVTPTPNVASGNLTMALNSAFDLAGNPVTAGSVTAFGSMTHALDTYAPHVTLSAVSTGPVVYGAAISGGLGVVNVTADNHSTVQFTFTGSRGVPVFHSLIGNGLLQAVTLLSGDVTVLGQGLVTVKASSLDGSGNPNVPDAASTAQFTLATLGPTATVTDNLSSSAAIVNQKSGSIIYTYTFKQAETGLIPANFTAPFATVNSVTHSPDNTVWSVTVTPDNQTNGSALPNQGSLLSITLNPGVLTDSNGNINQPITSTAHGIDMVAPLLSMANTLSGNPTTSLFNSAQALAPTGVNSVTAELGDTLYETITSSLDSSKSVVKILTGTGVIQAVALSSTDLTTLGQGLMHVTATETDAAGNLTSAGQNGNKFLGPFAGTPVLSATGVVSRSYTLTQGYDLASIDVDLLKLDNWAKGDVFNVYVNKALVCSFAPEDSTKAAGMDGATGSNSKVSGATNVSWTVQSSGVDSFLDAVTGSDRIYHLTLQIQGLSATRLTFGVGATLAAGNVNTASFGLDNVVTVSGHSAGKLPATSTNIDNETFEAGAATYWNRAVIGSYGAAYSEHPFSIDTVAPVVALSTLINQNHVLNLASLAAPMVVSGTVESDLSVALQIGTQFFAPKTSGVNWAYTLNTAEVGRLGQGTMTVTAIATDLASNQSIPVSTSLLIDTIAPTVTVLNNFTAPIINRTSGDVTFTYTFSAAVAKLGKVNFSTENCTVGLITSLTSDGTVWAVVVHPFLVTGAVGTMKLTLLAGALLDAAGNGTPNLVGALPIDTLTPVLASVKDNISGIANANTTSVLYTYTFNEAVTDLGTGSFGPNNNGVVTGVSPTSNSSVFVVTLAPTLNVSSGTITLTLSQGKIHDAGGNPSLNDYTESSQQIDSVAPSLTVTELGKDANNLTALVNYPAATGTGALSVTADAGASVTVTLTGIATVPGQPVIKQFNSTGGAQLVTLSSGDLTSLGDGVVHVVTTARDAVGNTSSVGAGGNTYLTTTSNPINGSVPAMRKSFSLDTSKNQVLITFDMLQIDSSESSEVMYVYLGSQQVIAFLPEGVTGVNTPYGTDGASGSMVSALGPLNWTVTSSGASGYLAGQPKYTDRSYQVTMLLTPSYPASTASLVLGLGSNLSSSSSDRIGIDNVVLSSQNAGSTGSTGSAPVKDDFEDGATGTWSSSTAHLITASYAGSDNDKAFTLHTVGAVITIDQGASNYVINNMSLSKTMLLTGTDPSGLPVTLLVGALSVPVTVNNTTWSATFRADYVLANNAQGTFTIRASITDSFDNTSVATRPLTVDTLLPTVTVTEPLLPKGVVNLVSGQTNFVQYLYTFNEPVQGLTVLSFSASNGIVAGVSGSGRAYLVTVAPATNVGSGAITLTLLATGGQDLAGNPLTADTNTDVQLDTVGPVLTVSNVNGNAVAVNDAQNSGVLSVSTETNANVNVTLTSAANISITKHYQPADNHPFLVTLSSADATTLAAGTGVVQVAVSAADTTSNVAVNGVDGVNTTYIGSGGNNFLLGQSQTGAQANQSSKPLSTSFNIPAHSKQVTLDVDLLKFDAWPATTIFKILISGDAGQLAIFGFTPIGEYGNSLNNAALTGSNLLAGAGSFTYQITSSGADQQLGGTASANDRAYHLTVTIASPTQSTLFFNLSATTVKGIATFGLDNYQVTYDSATQKNILLKSDNFESSDTSNWSNGTVAAYDPAYAGQSFTLTGATGAATSGAATGSANSSIVADSWAPATASSTVHGNPGHVMTLGDFGVATAGKDLSAVQIDSAAGLLWNGAAPAAGTVVSAAEIVAGHLVWQPGASGAVSQTENYHLIDTAGNVSAAGATLTLTSPATAATASPGAGDDRITEANLNFARIDGGAGFDVLEWTAPLSINLPALIGKIVNIEAIALGAGAQVLTLSNAAVTAMTSAGTLYLSHDASDTINFAEGIGSGASQWHTVSAASGMTLYQYFDAANHATLVKVVL